MLSFILLLISQILNSYADKNTLVWISLNGFPARFLNNDDAPFMYKFSREGTYTNKGMLSSFITTTYPNYFTQSTGLHVEAHGIISDNFIDSDGNWFNLSSTDSKWWNQNGKIIPIWIANQCSKNSLSSALINWPGGSVSFNNILPEYHHNDLYMDDLALNLLETQSLIKSKKYSLIMVHNNGVNTAGKLFGPNNAEFKKIIGNYDKIFEKFVKDVHSFSSKVSIIVTSGHGIRQLSDKKIVYVQETTNNNLKPISLGPVGLFNVNNNSSTAEKIVDQLNSLNNKNWIAYTRDNVPQEYHYSHNTRIPDIVVIGKDGWCIDYERENYSDECSSNGGYGYPNQEDESMYSLFFAKGHLFPIKYELKELNAIDLYPWFCNILNIVDSCAPNNGTVPKFLSNDNRFNKFYILLILILIFVFCGAVAFAVLYYIRRRRVLRTRDYFQIDPLLSSEETDQIFDLDW